MFMISLKISVTESGLTKIIEIKIPERFYCNHEIKVISAFLCLFCLSLFCFLLLLLLLGGFFSVRSFSKYSCKEKLKIFLGQGEKKSLIGDTLQRCGSILSILYVPIGLLFCTVLREICNPFPHYSCALERLVDTIGGAFILPNLKHRFLTTKLIFNKDR